ncbi:MAG: glycosyltransferase family 4 protein, partial [Deltaproteobacteria bacterium]|nr:glycosyltransferase family 4 protein [Deltaproteobacteria bacterium]
EPMLKGFFEQVIYVPADRFPWKSVGSYDVEPFKKATRRAVDQMDPLAVIVEYIWLTPCLDEVENNALKLIDAHGVVHVRNDFVFHRKILCEKWREIELLSKADVIMAIQKNDVDAFRKMVPERKVILVHHHSDIKKLEMAGDEETFAVIGDNHPPNLQALAWFLEKAWPTITRERPRAVFLVYGRMAEAAPDSSAIRRVGFVHDLEEAYRFARVMINPIQLGTGLKVKTVEALCYGKALVTTSCGADGLEEGAGSAFIMEDDPAAFGHAVVRLLGDDEARQQLEDSALQFARDHFSTKTAFAELTAILNWKKEN